MKGQGDGATGAVPRQRCDSGLGRARLGSSWENMQPQAIKSALPLIQDHSSRLIAVKNSSNGRKTGVWTICRSDGPARLWCKGVCLAFCAANPFPPEQTFSFVGGPMPGEGGFPPTEAAVGWGHGSGSLVSRAGPQPVT